MDHDYVVIDLDGTLWETTLEIDKNAVTDWTPYYEDQSHIEVCSPMMTIVRGFAREGAAIVYLTFRPEAFRNHTEELLSDFNAPVGLLFMQPDDNTLSDEEWKVNCFNDRIKPMMCGYDPLVVFDDKGSNVDAFRAIGLRVFQVAGDYK